MKLLLTLIAVAGTISIAGCANEGPTGDELQDQVGRGLRGEGTVSPDIDRSDDPYVKPREGRPDRRQ